MRSGDGLKALLRWISLCLCSYMRSRIVFSASGCGGVVSFVSLSTERLSCDSYMSEYSGSVYSSSSSSSWSEMEGGGEKASTWRGGHIAGVAKGSPNLCRSSADLVVWSDVVPSSELAELVVLVGLVLRLARLLLLAEAAGVVGVTVGPLRGAFLPACPCCRWLTVGRWVVSYLSASCWLVPAWSTEFAAMLLAVVVMCCP